MRGGTIRILIVATEPTETATNLETETDRFVVETATSVSNGFDRLTNADIDCIVSAHETPEIDAVEFLDAVRAEYGELPFVLYTESEGEAGASTIISPDVTETSRGNDGWSATLATRIVAAVDDQTTDSESTLKALHDAATTLQSEENVTRVCERTVAAAADILEFYRCSVMLREGEWLVPYAVSAGAQSVGSRRIRIDQGLAGKTFQRGESFVVSDVDPDDETGPTKESYRSAISVPIGDRGVFRAVSTVPNTFDAEDIELAELLVSHMASAVGQLEREAILKRQNERLDAFASIISHDLRNPLNIAGGRLALAREVSDNEHLEDIAVALDRMDTLVNDVLALSRQGEIVRDPECVSLSELSEISWEAVATAEATLEVDTDRAIWADRSRLQAMLENLFHNAVEHNSTNPASQAQRNNAEHGSDDVTVTVGALENGTGFYVEDDGVGIPEADRGSVFESGYSTAPAGVGLGLAIVSEIAEAHGWDRAVTASAAGGARFELSGVEWVDAESPADGYSSDPSISK
ncbi:ATP-binding protein [Natronorubrum sp. DTA7]|uniref:GAF domain-containing sensor histidine kinase n=1 Tax=Natronorubrum sp. DTA7 TaxID=3447016 RepID=UPI003F827F0D